MVLFVGSVVLSCKNLCPNGPYEHHMIAHYTDFVCILRIVFTDFTDFLQIYFYIFVSHKL